jgi:hypothetical protein
MRMRPLSVQFATQADSTLEGGLPMVTAGGVLAAAADQSKISLWHATRESSFRGQGGFDAQGVQLSAGQRNELSTGPGFCVTNLPETAVEHVLFNKARSTVDARDDICLVRFELCAATLLGERTAPGQLKPFTVKAFDIDRDEDADFIRVRCVMV